MAAQTIGQPAVNYGPIEAVQRKLRALSALMVSAEEGIDRNDLGGLAEIIDDVNDQLGAALEALDQQIDQVLGR